MPRDHLFASIHTMGVTTFTDSHAPSSIQENSALVRGLLTAGLLATAFVATPELSVGPEVMKAAFGGILVLIALAVWLWPGFSRRVVLWHPLLFVPVALAAYAMLSALWSPYVTALVEAGRWALVSAILLLMLNAPRRNYFESIVQSMHRACVGLSALALAQFWLGLEWFPATAAPGATFGNRNFFAELVASCVPLSLWLLSRRQTLASSLRAGLGVAVIVVALMSTGSRAALLASIVSVIVMVALLSLSRHKRFTLAPPHALFASIALMVMVVAGLGAIPSTNEHILRDDGAMQTGRTAIERTAKRLGSLAHSETYEDGSSFGIRRAGWVAATQMIARYPVQGIGAGAWNSISSLYMPEELDTQLIWMAHNEPLQLAVEYGLLGWVALLSLSALLATVSLGSLVQLRGTSRIQALRSLRKMVIVTSLVAMGIVGLSGLPLHAAATCYLMAIYVGLLLGSSVKVRVFVLPRLASSFGVVTKVAAVCLVATGLVISAQAMRSDYYVRQGTGVLLGLAEVPSSRTQQNFASLRDEAVDDIDKGLAIYPEHTLAVMSAISSLIQLGEHERALGYIKRVLDHLPHMVSVQCQRAQAHANLRDFDEAEAEINRIVNERPKAVCLPLTKFILAYKKDNFQEATALGKLQIATLTSRTRKDEARYWVDYTYRAAIRVSDWGAALSALSIRAKLWPELASGSWFLAGRLQAGLAQGKVSPEALDSFKKALSAGTRAEREQMLRDMPPAYRQAL